MKTHATKASEIVRIWYVVDADGVVLGRLASEIARILRGKHKPIYVPYLDTGDPVIVINAARVQLTGKKPFQKRYFRHSGYPGGERFISYQVLRKAHPDQVIRLAVRGMLPHNALGRQMLSKLKIYAGPTHPHKAQQPQPLRLAGAGAR